MTRLSVNINKVALLRNSRGGNVPDLLQFARDCESYGAQGITVHPRPDQRHIRFNDLAPLKELVTTEFNIEGYPSEHFIETVCRIRPHQVTLVPDPPDALTSDTGWDTGRHLGRLQEVVGIFHEKKIRVSLFVDPAQEAIEGAAKTGAERIELYTGPYAAGYKADREKAVAPYEKAGALALELGMGVNAGHDLNLDNLRFLKERIPEMSEVSIGHALIADALYYGMQNVVEMYLYKLRP
jgi:pyridoxine 5-phosphate synthase